MLTKTLDIARFIDHTHLRADAAKQDLVQLIDEAKSYSFRTVCVRPEWISFASAELAGQKTLPITVVGFPTGEETTAQKILETTQAIKNGAKEIDMVLNWKLLKQKMYKKVFEDISEIVSACGDIPLKVIIESAALTENEIKAASVLVQTAGAQFVKTSTGFGPGGATLDAIRWIKEVVSSQMEIKASGGVKTLAQVLQFIEAGATRIGSSNSVAIVTEFKNQQKETP